MWHRDNLPWIWQHGLNCGTSSHHSPDWVHIGSTELIDKRATHPVPISPGGVLNDYIPFYFTPFSVMLYNIHTGRGVVRRANEELAILVSSLPHLRKHGVSFVFTDMHAYYQWSAFYSDLSDLHKLDWKILQRRDFQRDQDDPRKFERYQAEALIHRHCPVDALLGVVCYTDELKLQIEKQLANCGHSLSVKQRAGLYF